MSNLGLVVVRIQGSPGLGNSAGETRDNVVEIFAHLIILGVLEVHLVKRNMNKCICKSNCAIYSPFDMSEILQK
jgi:hypothetical protein